METKSLGLHKIKTVFDSCPSLINDSIHFTLKKFPGLDNKFCLEYYLLSQNLKYCDKE